MSNSFFKFKQFTVNQDRCAMKVGTDGVVLGVTAEFSCCDVATAVLPAEPFAEGAAGESVEPLRLVDVGAGTGLVSLMVKQRHPSAVITAVEIDPDAASQAQENFDASPWKIEAVCSSWQNFASKAKADGLKFDGVFCNPPYFTASLKAPSEKRTQARHNDSLPFTELIQGVAAVLAENGLFYVILPAQDGDGFDSLAWAEGLVLSAVTYVHPVVGAEPKRVVMCYKKTPAVCVEGSVVKKHLYLESNTRGVYSDEFRTLIQPFYLKF